MKRGSNTVDAFTAVPNGKLTLLLGACLFSATGFAQTKLDPMHTMSPSQLRWAGILVGPGLPPTERAVPVVPANKAAAKPAAVDAIGRPTPGPMQQSSIMLLHAGLLYRLVEAASSH